MQHLQAKLCSGGRKKKESGHREDERLSTTCLGSVLVLEWGSWAEVGKCLCGFVWIIIMVLCGWAAARKFLLSYAAVFLFFLPSPLLALWGRMCYSSRPIVPASPHRSTTRTRTRTRAHTHTHTKTRTTAGRRQQTGTDCCTLLLYDDLWSRGWRWWEQWKIRLYGYREAAIASVLRFITPHCAIKNDKCPNYLHFPCFQPMPYALRSASLPPFHPKAFLKEKKIIRSLWIDDFCIAYNLVTLAVLS